MGIYRGPGGTGDAVNDASSEALLTVQAKDAALAAQAAAEAAQVAAELAETNAETAETNAETAETNAETAETNAETAATNAASSASAASTSASNAASSASAASTSASNASTSATNASNSASAASTSATNAANSASAASTSATNASNSASAAATSATNASNSASAASTSATNASNSATAAQTAETNAETAETNAAASASAASTSASNASSSASAASTSASNAATSATNASNSASAASTSATNASNSASAASTSATNASNSASAAATSATNAAASYDSFDDRYLGAKSSAPSVDNDGNTLLVGALYYDTVSSSMKVWSGTAWLDAYASLSGALLATNNLSDLNNTTTARTNLGVAIGVNVQAYDQQLADVAGLTPSDNNFIVGNGTNFVTESGSTARTSLGLGSIATQDSSNVTVTGGSINGTTIGASTASTGRFSDLTDTGLTATRVIYAGTGGNLVDSANLTFDGTTLTAAELSDSGNLTFTGTGNRIRGDFSNGTQTNRVSFQTSTTNGNSVVGILPNGTATTSVFRAFNNSDPTNAAEISIFASSSTNSLISGITGTGTYLPLTMLTGGSERLRIDTSGNVGIGTSSPGAKLDVLGANAGSVLSSRILNTSTSANSDTQQFIYVNGASAGDPYITWTVGGVSAWSAGIRNSDSDKWYLSVSSSLATTPAMVVDTSGNVGIGTSSPTSKLQSQTSSSGSTPNMLSLVNNTGSAANATGVKLWMSGRAAQADADRGVYIEAVTTDTNNAHAMAFATSASGTAPSERMRIDSSGQFIVGPFGGNGNAVIAGSSSPSFTNQPGTNLLLKSGDGSGTGSSFMTFSTSPAGSSGTTVNTAVERMRIDSSGNVGIGISDPASYSGRLTVAGNVAASAGNNLRVWDSANTTYVQMNSPANRTVRWTNDAGTEYFRFGSAGQLGIAGANYGSSGQVLTSNGSSSAPSWQSPSGGITTTTGSAPYYGARAWVNFNGSGTVSIRASVNVSSISDNGTGDYTVNFSTAMPDANYNISGSCGRNGSGANANIMSVADNTSAPTTSAVRINTRGDNGTSTDIDLVSVSIHR